MAAFSVGCRRDIAANCIPHVRCAHAPVDGMSWMLLCTCQLYALREPHRAAGALINKIVPGLIASAHPAPKLQAGACRAKQHSLITTLTVPMPAKHQQLHWGVRIEHHRTCVRGPIHRRGAVLCLQVRACRAHAVAALEAPPLHHPRHPVRALWPAGPGNHAAQTLPAGLGRQGQGRQSTQSSKGRRRGG